MKLTNIFAELPIDLTNEHFSTLAETPGVRIERIVSNGQGTPAGEWYDQEQDEWVLLMKGSAALLFAGEAESHVLEVGDHLMIPAHTRHRVEWTAIDEPTIWLAVHMIGRQ